MRLPSIHKQYGVPEREIPVPPKALAIPEVHPSPASHIEKLKELEQSMVSADLPPLNIDDCTTHHFADGLYARQWVQPAGTLATSKTHKLENFLVLLSGECAITDGVNSVRYLAPSVVKTMPGVKRAVLAITDICIMTFHPNPDNERGIPVLESRYLIPETFPERPALELK